MNTDKLKQLKELLDMGAISQEEFDSQKKELMQNEKPGIKKNLGLVIGIIFVVIICISIIANSNPSQDTVAQKNMEASAPTEFSNPCPVEVSASLYDNIIGMPELKCSIKNTTEKEIAAVKIYFIPKDVYGEEINTVFTTHELYTDTAISPGSTSARNWQLMDNAVKSGDVYVYSVYFSDGTEWGKKEVPASDIKKYAYKISVKY